jgi:hypothetical protein
MINTVSHWPVKKEEKHDRRNLTVDELRSYGSRLG